MPTNFCCQTVGNFANSDCKAGLYCYVPLFIAVILQMISGTVIPRLRLFLAFMPVGLPLAVLFLMLQLRAGERETRLTCFSRKFIVLRLGMCCRNWRLVV